ncbi:MAG: hypothetical protein ACR2LR_04155 [Hassallia sp.]
MARYEVVIKRIVSPDSKMIAEVKSVATASGDNQGEIRQTVSVNISSSTSSSSSSSSSSCAN